MSPNREDELAMASKNPFAEWADDRLVAAAYLRGNVPPQATEVEMMRRLKGTIVEQQEATNDLSERIRKLNVWLLWVTVVIGALTLVQVLTGLKVIGR